MSKPKVSPEARVIAYFEEAPIDHAEMLLGIVKARVRMRSAPAILKPKSHKAKGIAKAKVNAKPEPTTATSFPPRDEVAS